MLEKVQKISKLEEMVLCMSRRIKIWQWKQCNNCILLNIYVDFKEHVKT